MTTQNDTLLDDTHIGRVSLKPPPFYRNNPVTWFRQLESQFHLSGINREDTRYHHVLAHLPEDVAINLPTDATTYTTLKTHIISLFQKSRQQLIDEALGSLSLDGQKPSLCLLRLQRKLQESGVQLDEETIKHRLLKALPPTTATALAAHTTLPLSDFARLADTMSSYLETATVNAVSGQTPHSSSQSSHLQHNPQRSYSSYSHNTPHNGLQPFNSAHRQKICRYHIFYADNAKCCKPWCKWPGRKPKNIEPSSRPASPKNV